MLSYGWQQQQSWNAIILGMTGEATASRIPRDWNPKQANHIEELF